MGVILPPLLTTRRRVHACHRPIVRIDESTGQWEASSSSEDVLEAEGEYDKEKAGAFEVEACPVKWDLGGIHT